MKCITVCRHILFLYLFLGFLCCSMYSLYLLTKHVVLHRFSGYIAMFYGRDNFKVLDLYVSTCLNILKFPYVAVNEIVFQSLGGENIFRFTALVYFIFIYLNGSSLCTSQ